MNIQGKVCVVSGAGSGIGRALALEMAKKGGRLAISDVDPQRLSDVSQELEELGAEVHSQTLDVRSWPGYQAYAQEVIDHFGQVDIVINNAGVALGSYTVENIPIDQFEWLMDINFWGMVYGTKVFLPHLRKRKEAAVANVSSILGLGAISNQSAYCSSKFAIRGFTESLRMESFVDFPQVNVLSIHPGGIQTNIAKDARWADDEVSKQEQEELAQNFEKTFINTPTYAANDIIEAIEKKKKRLLIGSDAKKMWRLISWFPVSYTQKFLKSFMKDADPSLKNKNI